MNIIRGSGQVLLSLINDVLDLSKIDAERMELEDVEFDLRELIYEAASLTALQGASKGIELIANVDAGVPTIVRGDPGRLRQVVMNLSGNALKFTHQGHVVINVFKEAGNGLRTTLHIDVSDTGIGIPADRINRLFKPFSQVDASTTRHYGGSGLGLSIVKRLSELMGGTTSVTSEPGSGSVFTVTLGVKVVADQPTIPPIGAGRRVLLVDDNTVARHSLVEELELSAFDVVQAASVDDALQILANADIDVVVADEWMPTKGGIDLLVMLRTDVRTYKIPLVLLSLIGADSNKAGWTYQPDAIVLKPTRSRTLATIVDRVRCGSTSGLAAPPPAVVARPVTGGARILVVEDNLVNQRVAQHLLEKLQVRVTIANNGAEALELVATSIFDAILMDCQMPVMDGFTATRRIRDAERERGAPRIPIVALTANVTSEDRDNCVAAGMDAHLAKPMEPLRLAECLDRFLTRSPTVDAVDIEELQTLTGGDRDFERTLLETFIKSGDECLAKIADALEILDFDTVGRCAHSLKCAGAHICAHAVAAAAADLETAANDRSSSQIHVMAGRLVADVHAVKQQWHAPADLNGP